MAYVTAYLWTPAKFHAIFSTTRTSTHVRRSSTVLAEKNEHNEPAGVRSESKSSQKNWHEAESASNSERAIPSAPYA